MNLHGIVTEWLVQRGYDGLFDPDDVCACKLDCLMPCGDPGMGCRPGYLAPCPGAESEMYDGDCKFHIVATKPEGAET